MVPLDSTDTISYDISSNLVNVDILAYTCIKFVERMKLLVDLRKSKEIGSEQGKVGEILSGEGIEKDG